MLNYLKNLLVKRKEKLKTLQERNSKSENLDEVRNLGTEITEVTEEIRSLETQITELEKVNSKENEQRNIFNPNQALNISTINMQQGENNESSTRSSKEYRTAFMQYVQTGKMNDILQVQKRADSTGVSTDLGILLPETVVQKIITELDGVYGTIYSRVAKTNLVGGVKYPIGSFVATFKRITETTTSNRQKVGNVSGYVQFGYNIGEIKLARTLLQTVLSVDVFEEKYAKAIVKAYLKAMDLEIIKGNTANNECEGILTEAEKGSGVSRIKDTHIISFTAEEIANWTEWEKKLFAVVSTEMEGLNPEFVMAKQTYVSNLVTLKDNNNQPIKKAGYDITDKMYKFNEYGVLRVEQDIFKAFDLCEDGEYFGMFWVPENAYVINTNLEFVTKRYFDEETNQWIDKALVINDGKVLDPEYIYLLKKTVTA